MAVQGYLYNQLRFNDMQHMPGGERRKPIDIEDCRTKVKVTTSKSRTKM
jgi:hypothetical protein